MTTVVNFLGFECPQELYGMLEDWSVIEYTGSYSFSYVTGHGGKRCALMTRTGSDTLAFVVYAPASNGIEKANLNLATTYISFYIKLVEWSGITREPIMAVFDTAATPAAKCYLDVDSNRNLVFVNSAGSVVATGSTVLDISRWYRIDLKCGTGASGAYEVRIGTSVELSGTANLGTLNSSCVKMGRSVGRNAITTYTVQFDDLVIASDSYPSPTDYCIMHYFPVSDGYYTTWDYGYEGFRCGAPWSPAPGSSGYDYTIGHVTTCNFSQLPAGIVDADIVSVAFGFEAGNPPYVSEQIAMRIRSGTTDVSTSSFYFNYPRAYCGIRSVRNTNPSGGGAWTVSAVNSVQAGPVYVGGSGWGIYCTDLSMQVIHKWVPGFKSSVVNMARRVA